MKALATLGTSLRLAELEATIERGQDTFLAVGRALLEIRESQAFREAGYSSFSDYLAERFPKLARRSAYSAIAAASVDVDGLSGSHLVELARLDGPERARMAALAAARGLSVRELRALIRERQAASAPRRPDVLQDHGPVDLVPELACRLEVRDCRSLPFEDGAGHLERRHGAACEGPDCPHPALVLESPPYNAGLRYDADPTGDRLPWRAYWHELLVPHFREVYRVLMPSGRFACNLANVLRMNNPPLEHQRADRVYREQKGRKWSAPGAGGAPWAYMIDRLLWSTWARLGFLPRERFTWVKLNRDDDDGDPRNTITESSAWGTWCSPENPVARAVAEPIFVASKGSHARQRPAHAISESIDGPTFLRLTRNAWFIPNTVDRSRHPAPWPRGVPENLLLLYSWPGDLVANPFVGSGASAEVAVELGRRFWGADRSAVYVHDAQRRVAAAQQSAQRRARYVEGALP
jgi:modification methylase